MTFCARTAVDKTKRRPGTIRATSAVRDVRTPVEYDPIYLDLNFIESNISFFLSLDARTDLVFSARPEFSTADSFGTPEGLDTGLGVTCSAYLVFGEIKPVAISIHHVALPHYGG